MDWPDLITAIAAIAAVALSITTFRLTARRDEKNWKRDELMAAMVQFLDGSFQRYSLRGFDLKISGETVQKYHDRSSAGRHEQNLALTRLRLLGSAKIVHCAEIVRASDDVVAQWFHEPLSAPPPEWAELNRDRQEARTTLVSAYREEFKLGAAKPITSHTGGSIEWLKALKAG